MEIDESKVEGLLSKKWTLCTEKDKREGLYWYLHAHDFALSLALRYDLPLNQVAGIIAALSPRNRWSGNKKDAEKVLENFRQGLEITQATFSSPFPKATNVNKILDGVPPEETLGQKSRSFYRCIYNPLCDDVCIDTWAARAVDYTEKWISKKDYPILQGCYRKVARELSLVPSSFQAVIWVYERGGGE